jgi:adenine-specific DNA methylase
MTHITNNNWNKSNFCSKLKLSQCFRYYVSDSKNMDTCWQARQSLHKGNFPLGYTAKLKSYSRTLYSIGWWAVETMDPYARYKHRERKREDGWLASYTNLNQASEYSQRKFYRRMTWLKNSVSKQKYRKNIYFV